MMQLMGIAKKLTHWKSAGLITAKQENAILAYEREHKGGRFMTGLTGVAILAILCGVLSLVAANWMDIPASAKIGVHALLNIIVAAALYRADRDVVREGLCLLLFGLTLTLIALIGQAFQLGGNWANALVLWLVITAPLMLAYGETRITAVPWMLAFLISVVVVMAEYMPGLDNFRDTVIVIGIGAFLPLALIADGNIGLARNYKPVWGRVFVTSGFILLVLSATIASIVWYNSLTEEFYLMALEAGLHYSVTHIALVAILLLALGVQTFYAWRNHFYRDDDARGAAAQIAALSTLFALAPFVVTLEGGPIAATLHVLLYWGALGYIAQTQGWHRLVTLAILVMAFRIFAAYCELFGDLMTTGYALIAGGVIMLLLIWGSLRLNAYLKRERVHAKA